MLSKKNCNKNNILRFLREKKNHNANDNDFDDNNNNSNNE